MSYQAPLLWVPLKSTSDVSYSASIRSTIASVYQENPDSYKDEIASLDRCRQDALRGSAGSDVTGRDLLYKYFGQLELLELRFPEVRVPFPWKDAFTAKEISQLSLAYEKASVIFNIASTLSSLAASQNRFSPEGLKRAFYNFRCSAGMFTYINDNFLHAPSTDLSRDVVKVLVQIMVAQATEVFGERMKEEKKGMGLRARVSTQVAFLYGGIVEDVRELVTKGTFERSWTWLIQAKHKYFISLAQFQRSSADTAASKHGDALSRLQVAEAAAKEASRFAASFSAAFHGMLGTATSSTLPSDAGGSLLELTKAHLALCTETKASAQKDNDLIYHEATSSEASLPAIEKSSVAEPIPIQEVYGAPEVQKVVGQDIFVRLVPLSVHESASLYSEEKAKLVRTEGERCDLADGELEAALEYMGIPGSLDKFRDAAGIGNGNASRLDALAEPPSVVRGWAEEVRKASPPTVDELFRQIGDLRASAGRDLGEMATSLDSEFRECESMRVKYGHLWEQPPSAGLTKAWRGEIKSLRESLEKAGESDEVVKEVWRGAQKDISEILADPSGDGVERIFVEAAAGRGSGGGANLLDVEDSAEEEEVPELKRHIQAIEEAVSRLNSIKKERQGVFRDLKERIQSDDISQLLILNRKSSNIEPALFAAELEKFRPHSGRIAATVHHQGVTLQDLNSHYKAMTDGKKAKEIQERWAKANKRRKEVVGRLQRAKEGHDEVRAGLGKGASFYRDLNEAVDRLRRQVTGFVNQRSAERDDLIARVEGKQRMDQSRTASQTGTMSPVSAPTPNPHIQSLEQQVRSMELGPSTRSPAPPLPPPPPTSTQPQRNWQPTPSQNGNSLPPPSPPTQAPTYQSFPSYTQASQAPPPPPPRKPSYPPPPAAYSSPPPPPQQPAVDPYANLGALGSLTTSPLVGPQTPNAAPYGAPSYVQRQPSYPPPQGPAYSSPGSALPPPPPSVAYQSQVATGTRPMSGYASPPPPQQPYQAYAPPPASTPYGQPPPAQWQQQPPPPQTSHQHSQGSGPRYSGPPPPPPQQGQPPYGAYQYGQQPLPPPQQGQYAPQQPYYGGQQQPQPPQGPGAYQQPPPQPQYGGYGQQQPPQQAPYGQGQRPMY